MEIINWLDDHSRYLLGSRAYGRITGQIVITKFLAASNLYGLPQSTLTDNGSVYTSRFTGGRNGFEYLLASPRHHPEERPSQSSQTPGQDRTLHQTLKRWLAAQPAVETITELRTQLDTFAGIYDQIRPHRALHGATRRRPTEVPPLSLRLPGHYFWRTHPPVLA